MSRESIAGWRDRVVAMHKAEEVIMCDCDDGDRDDRDEYDYRSDLEIFEASLRTVKVDEVAPILAGVYGCDVVIEAMSRLPGSGAAPDRGSLATAEWLFRDGLMRLGLDAAVALMIETHGKDFVFAIGRVAGAMARVDWDAAASGDPVAEQDRQNLLIWTNISRDPEGNELEWASRRAKELGLP